MPTRDCLLTIAGFGAALSTFTVRQCPDGKSTIRTSEFASFARNPIRHVASFYYLTRLVPRAQPPVQIEGSADQRQMRKRLWKIAQRLALGPRLLCVKPQMVGITQHTLEEEHGLIKFFRLGLTRACQCFYEPE